MNASAIVSKKSAAMEAVNQLIRDTDMQNNEKKCIETNQISNSQTEEVVVSTDEVEVKAPKKKAAPKKSKKEVEEVVVGEDGEPVVSTDEVEVKAPKKKAAPKKSKKDTTEVVESVYLEKDESVVAIVENKPVVENSSTKKIQTLRDPIHYLKSFMNNVHNTSSFPEEMKDSFQTWLNTIDDKTWKTMSIFPSFHEKKEDCLVVVASPDNVQEQTHSVAKSPTELVVEGVPPSDQNEIATDTEEYEEVELIVEEIAIDGVLYLIDSNQDLYDPETFAYIRNMKYAT